MLISVLVVIVLLSLAAYQYSALMLSEYKAADNSMRLAQARAFAHSGVHYMAALLSNPDNLSGLLGDNPYNNDLLANVEVSTGYDNIKGRFKIVAPVDAYEGGDTMSYRNGVQDEAGKINVNGIMKLDPTGKTLQGMLVKIGIPDDIADAIVDWLDADDTPGTLGAESEYYSALGYQAKNQPIDSLEELLLVKGIADDPTLLFGTDRNRNGIQDEGEDDGNGFSLGWSAFLTVYGRESLVDTSNNPLIDVNGDDLQTLYDQISPEIGEDLAKFILLYRLYSSGSSGSSSSSSSNQSSSISTSARRAAQTVVVQMRTTKTTTTTTTSQTVDGSLSSLSIDSLDLTQAPQKKLTGFVELVGAEVTIQSKDPKMPSVRYKSPLTDKTMQAELLPKLFQKATTNSGKTDVFGRININIAPYEVLQALPGLAEGDADKIYQARPKLMNGDPLAENFKTPTWLLTDAGLSRQTVSGLEKYVTTQSQIYRVQVVGYFENETMSPSARVEAVIDVNNGRPRILFWRDLSELGRGAEMQQ